MISVSIPHTVVATIYYYYTVKHAYCRGGQGPPVGTHACGENRPRPIVLLDNARSETLPRTKKCWQKKTTHFIRSKNQFREKKTIRFLTIKKKLKKKILEKGDTGII